MDEDSLTSEEIQKKYLNDIKDRLRALKEFKSDWDCSEREDFENAEIIWEYLNTVLFVFPIGEDVSFKFIKLLTSSDLIWMQPQVTLYNGRLAVRVVLLEAFRPNKPTRN
jgi:hypothetical protein